MAKRNSSSHTFWKVFGIACLVFVAYKIGENQTAESKRDHEYQHSRQVLESLSDKGKIEVSKVLTDGVDCSPGMSLETCLKRNGL